MQYFQFEYYNRKGNETFLLDYEHSNSQTADSFKRPVATVCKTHKIIPHPPYEGQHWDDEFCLGFDQSMNPTGDVMTFDGHRREVGLPKKYEQKKELTSVTDDRCKVFCPEFMKSEMKDKSVLILNEKLSHIKPDAWKECAGRLGC